MLTAGELYSFDVNGYLLLKKVHGPELLARLNRTVDLLQPRLDLAKVKPGTDARIEPILPEDDAFIEAMLCPVVMSCLPQLIRWPRLRSTWLDFKPQFGGIGHHSNHTPHNPMDAYHFQDGRIYASALVACTALGDIPAAGGALEVLPGSHKANYPLPEDPATLASLRRKLAMSAGDVLLFSHDLNHGAHNELNYVRRTLFATFANGFSANRLGGNDLNRALFARMPENSWRKYLLRDASPRADTYPCPAHSPLEEVNGVPPKPVGATR